MFSSFDQASIQSKQNKCLQPDSFVTSILDGVSMQMLQTLSLSFSLSAASLDWTWEALSFFVACFFGELAGVDLAGFAACAEAAFLTLLRLGGIRKRRGKMKMKKKEEWYCGFLH